MQKWPFYLADIILSAIAAYVLTQFAAPQGTTGMVVTLACLAAAGWGAWLSITPWLVEYRTLSTLAENKDLKSTLEQIQSLEKVADLIRQSNSQWQGVQDASGRTVTAAREIADKMKVETEEFMKFIENAHSQERAGLRLEVDKLRKMEGDWIKVAVQMLDHVFALFKAAEQSGQANLVAQLGQFQNACREVARRMGLAPFVPAAGEKFDARGHQLPNPPAVVDENAVISEVLATGFTYQGQLLRRSLVLLAEPEPVAPGAEAAMAEEPLGDESAPADAEPGAPKSELAPEPEPEIQAESEPPAIIDSTGRAVEPFPEPPSEAAEAATREAVRRSRSPKPSAQNELPLA